MRFVPLDCSQSCFKGNCLLRFKACTKHVVTGPEHAQQQLQQAVAAALKQASAAAGSSPAVWGLYAQYYR